MKHYRINLGIAFVIGFIIIFTIANHAETQTISNTNPVEPNQITGNKMRYVGPFANTSNGLGGSVILDIDVEPTTVSGNINFTDGPDVAGVLCGAGSFNGTRSGNDFSFSFVSNDPEPGCAPYNGITFNVNGKISGNEIIGGTYHTPSLNQGGTFSAKQTIRSSGDFFNDDLSLGGDVYVDLATWSNNTIAGYINFTGDPNLCGANSFTGTRSGNKLTFSFLSSDQDGPECDIIDNERFNVTTTLSGNSHQNGTYYLPTFGQGGTFSTTGPAVDTTIPNGNITSPSPQTTIESGAHTITANASDNSGGTGISYVNFFVKYNDSWHFLGTDPTSPYLARWQTPTNLPSQQVELAIDVYDKSGNHLDDAGGYIPINFVTPIHKSTVNGTIRNSITNQTLANVGVSIGGKTSRTNANGQYTIANVPYGNHTLRATLSGYKSYKSAVSVNSSNTQRNFNLIPIPTDGFKLPYPGGKRYVTTQGNNSNFSHNGPSAYAFDFGLPINAPVVAARSGYVVNVKENSTRGDCDPAYSQDANYVTIRHQDNTLSQYVHLAYNSVPVKKGDTVQRGQVIGKVGLTGWVCGAHLHYQRLNSTWNPTILTRFMDVSSNGGVPLTGHAYTSGNYIGSLINFNSYPEQGFNASSEPEGIVQFWLTGESTSLVQLFATDYDAEITQMRLADTKEDLVTTTWQPYTVTATWESNEIWAQFKTSDEQVTAVYSDTIDVIAYEPIQANFEFESTQVCTDELVQINNRTTPYCQQCSWHWDLGNGQTSQFANPSEGNSLNMWQGNQLYYGVVYPEPGQYTATLTASGANNTSTFSQDITVIESISADFSIQRNGNTIHVQALNGNATNWEWDFGDGTKANGQSTSHTYTNNLDSPIVITLEAQAANGCTGKTHQVIQDHYVFLPLIQN